MAEAVGEGPRLRFEVLGPVRVWRRGHELDLGPRQQRLILALLLVREGRPVGIADLVSLLWDDAPPLSAVNIVHRYVGNLRRLFEPGLRPREAGHWLVSDAAGYRMPVDADGLDLLRLRSLARRARAAGGAGRTAEAMAAYAEALALWRGPCAGAPDLLPRPFAAFDAVDHEYHDLVHEAADLALRTDGARSILGVLRRVADRRPLDEAVQAKLLLALSAAGQQAEAIVLYQGLRRRLADELGVDPGDELRGAYQEVLHQSAEARESPPPRADDHEPAADPLVRLRPAQLFLDLPHFVGRDDVMRRAHARITGQAPSPATSVLVIEGIPGIGKTSLAIHLAHELAEAYPDGQLCADLRGLDPRGAALRSHEVMKAFLNALGVRDSEIPAGDLARSGLYRSVLAGRRVLIVLDNARDADQVRPLLPGAPGCLVLVTSRNSLIGLAAAQGAQTLTLDLPSMAEARQLLSARIGATRALADPRAVDEIIDLCGRLPLALAIVAARASAHPDHGLTTVVRELRQAHGSLDGFAYHGPDADLRVIFSWSYRMLTPPVAQVFRLLSLHPGAEATLPAIASLIGLPLRGTRALIGELVRSRLLTEHQPGRYGFHDLIRAYARELVLDHEPEAERGEATDRLLAYYRQAAYDANLYLTPEIDADPPSRIDRVAKADFTSANDAVDWFTTERHVLKAVMRWAIDRGHATDAWQLELTVQGFYQREGWWHEWATVVRECLDAATAAGDSPGRAEMMRSLAGALFYLGDHDSAGELLKDALKIFTDLGNLSRRALTLRHLGQVCFARHEYPQSVAHYDHALRIFASLEDLPSQVDVLCGLADVQYELDAAEAGEAAIGRALAISREIADEDRQGECLINRAERRLLQKDYPAALADWTAAEEIFLKTDYRTNSIRCSLGLGDTAYAMGDRVTARTAWLKALALLNDAHAPEEADIRARLARLDSDDWRDRAHTQEKKRKFRASG